MNEAPHSCFIVFEGIDGSGKTTQSLMLRDRLEKNKCPVLWLREPSDSKWGKKIREISRTRTRIPPEEELNYFIEDRKWNVEHNIKPALLQKKIVILDRYYFSTACYQGARGLSCQDIISRNRRFAPSPDITLIIDVDVNVAMTRIKNNRNIRMKLFEKKSFLEKVRKNYLALSDPSIEIIDGTPAPDTVFSRIISVLKDRHPGLFRCK